MRSIAALDPPVDQRGIIGVGGIIGGIIGVGVCREKVWDFQG
jgi:hypothetical protein